MKRDYRIYFYVLTFLTIIVFLIFQMSSVKAYSKIDPKEVKQYVDFPKDDTIILDVRTPEEFNSGHIKTSINIPLQVLDSKVTNLNKDIKIILYCKSGVRSKKAGEILEGMGFKNVFVLGGLTDWPYDLEK